MSNGKKDIVKIADGTTWIRAHMRWFARVLLNEWLHLDAGMESKCEVMNIITEKKIMQNIWTRALTYFRNTFRCNIHFATVKCAFALCIFMACRRNHAWILAKCVCVCAMQFDVDSSIKRPLLIKCHVFLLAKFSLRAKCSCRMFRSFVRSLKMNIQIGVRTSWYV